MKTAAKPSQSRAPLLCSLRGFLAAFALVASLIAARSIIEPALPTDQLAEGRQTAVAAEQVSDIFQKIGLLARSDG